jgi:hypothetical protein
MTQGAGKAAITAPARAEDLIDELESGMRGEPEPV